MKLLFQSPHLIEVQSLRDLLTAAGIESFLRNEHHSFFAQGAIATGVMPEVWVADECFAGALSVKEDWCEENALPEGKRNSPRE